MAYKVFIGVGHGGADSGAVGYLVEKDVNLNMAKACRDYLEAHGVIVKMSRTKDENDDLREEIRECNAFDPDVACDIHDNSGKGDGFEAYYSIVGGLGKELAHNIEKEVKKIGQNSRGCKTRKNSSGTDYYGFIRQTKAPAVIVEGVFVDNKKDAAQADTLAEQKKFGVAYAKGILKTLGVTTKQESTASIKKGDKVILSKNATVYQGADKGVKIPSSVKGKKYTVAEVDGSIVRLKEINSWVLKKEVSKSTGSSIGFKPYKVKVTASSLNVRDGAGTKYKINMAIVDKGVYTIVDEKGDWGKLKSGAGWIHLGYTKKV